MRQIMTKCLFKPQAFKAVGCMQRVDQLAPKQCAICCWLLCLSLPGTHKQAANATPEPFCRGAVGVGP